jgi:predicted dehydrogenase
MEPISRRKFIRNSGSAVLAGQLIGTSHLWAGANDRVRVATVGCHGRGKTHIAGFEELDNVEMVAICDIDELVLKDTQNKFKDKYGRELKTYVDLRELYENKDVDVISIATPNHWHSLAAIWACKAGKDVYVEKPGTHNIFEGRKLIEAAKKYDRIVQHGVQLRSSAAIQEAVELLRDGIIGNVYMARGLCFRWRPSIGHKPPKAEAPEHVDYNLWLGPAQKRPFSENLVHYNWHWHWDFGNGDVGNQGVHETDMCLWGLGLDHKFPSKVTSMGGKFLWDDDKETPEVLSSVYKYEDDNKLVQFEVRPWCTNDEMGATVGNIFYGEGGILVIKGYETYEVYEGRDNTKTKERRAGGNHFANFIDAVRAHDTSIQNGPVETAHYSSGIAHLGNISYRLGRTLSFDPEKEKFVNDPEADKMLTRDYREPFTIPTELL